MINPEAVTHSAKQNEPIVKIFGTPSYFPKSVLPTYDDVNKRCLLSKEEISVTLKKPKIEQIIEPVVVEVKEIWLKSSIPTVSQK